MKQKVAVIGSGPMGLLCAYRLLQRGYDVDIYEKNSYVGGMSATFDFDGEKIEKFYHFICKTDYPAIETFNELGIGSKVYWKKTKMGFFSHGKLFPWSHIFDLIKFPYLDILSKIRYGLLVFSSKNKKNSKTLDNISAEKWLTHKIGKKGYNILWKNLLYQKFHKFHNQISAEWIMARIRRVAKSRTNIFNEELGYLEGGSDTFLKAIKEIIINLGGKILLNSAPDSLIIEDDVAKGIILNSEKKYYDSIASTAPLPLIRNILPKEVQVDMQKILDTPYLGVRCLIMKLKQSLSPNFWINIGDEKPDLVGIVEYSNLNKSKNGHLIYFPFYLPEEDKKNTFSKDDFLTEIKPFLQKINPDFQDSWILDSCLTSYRYAQPVCSVGFYDKNIP